MGLGLHIERDASDTLWIEQRYSRKANLILLYDGSQGGIPFRYICAGVDLKAPMEYDLKVPIEYGVAKKAPSS